MPKPEDRSTTHQSVSELILMLRDELVSVQDPILTPHASKEERASARWLYEQLVNYSGMLRKRPLTRSIEFITRASGPGFSMSGTGWYYQPIKPTSGASSPAFNWYGPYTSHHEAEQARIANLPKTKTKLLLAQLLED